MNDITKRILTKRNVDNKLIELFIVNGDDSKYDITLTSAMVRSDGSIMVQYHNHDGDGYGCLQRTLDYFNEVT